MMGKTLFSMGNVEETIIIIKGFYPTYKRKAATAAASAV